MIRFTLFTVLAVFAISCDSPTHIPNFPSAKTIMPLAIGNYWVFDHWNSYGEVVHFQDTVTFTEIFQLEGFKWYWFYGDFHSGLFREDETGIYFREHIDLGDEVSKYVDKTARPGDWWYEIIRPAYRNDRDEIQTDTIIAKYIDNRDAVLEYGITYKDCLYIEREFRYWANGRRINVINEDYWYWKPGVGPIKYSAGLHHEMIGYRVSASN